MAGRPGPTRLAAVLTGALLTFSSMVAQSEEQAATPPDQAEFIDMLEYLGSWDGAEEDWVQFLGDADDPNSANFDIERDPSTQEASAGGS